MRIVRHYFRLETNLTLQLPPLAKVLSFGQYDERFFVDMLEPDAAVVSEDRKFLIYEAGSFTGNLRNRHCYGHFDFEGSRFYVFEGGMVGV